MTPFDTAVQKLEFEKVRQRIVRYATSDPGKDLLASLAVFVSLGQIKGSLEEVSEMKRLLEEEEPPPLDGIHPVRISLQRAGIEGTVLQPRDLLHIGSTLRASRLLRAYAAKRRETFPLLWLRAEPLYTDKVLEYNIEQAIDESAAIKPGASKELRSIRSAINEKYEQLKRRLQAILKGVAGLGFAQEEIITTREGRMVIPVKAEHKTHVPGFIHSASSSGATVFIEPAETLDLNNDIRSLHFQEQREIERILRDLTEQVGNQRTALLDNLAILAEVDALQAKGKYSIEILGAAPAVYENGPLKLVQAKHPILLMNHGLQGTVPLDVELNPNCNTLIISGPNAGGKSVAMKSIGLLALMVQAGLHVPASDQSGFPMFTSMFVDIGDDQSIESDLSTFSSHLSQLNNISNNADAKSLVLIDEIGSGTDPTEGGAIAGAFLEAMTKRGAYTVATTHHGALKVFAHETAGVMNGAMEFDRSTLTPTYRFRAGVPGSSYALEMAERLGFSAEMMSRARTMAGEQQTHLESLIAELEASVQRHRKDTEELGIQKARADELMRRYETRIAMLSSELKEMKRKALEEASRIVERANAVIEQSVQEIREHGADKAAIRKARESIVDLKREIVAQQEEISPVRREKTGPIAVGEHVTLEGKADIGEVVNISADGKTATVVFGIIKMRVPVGDLRPATEEGSRRSSSGSFLLERPTTVAKELDLRGLTGDEALPLVDKFIDDAVLAGLTRIDIIHGKGTGALRKKVTEFLSSHPRVRSYRLGEWNEGGTGATVVELLEE